MSSAVCGLIPLRPPRFGPGLLAFPSLQKSRGNGLHRHVFGPLGMVLRKAKFSRQGTFAPQDSDILNAIDQKFEEMEETIILASLVPQLHERLHAVEQMLRIDVAAMWSPDNVQLDMETEPKPPKPIWGEEASPKASAQAKSASEKDFTPVNLESTKSEAKVEPNVSDLTSMTPASKRASVPKVIEISRSKVKEMDEKTLDTQTTEYYTFGESTWDLVIFIGTGALGPFGSFQTVLLAIVNVLMQVVFVAIAYYNFTTPDINDSSIVDTLRCGLKGCTRRHTRARYEVCLCARL